MTETHLRKLFQEAFTEEPVTIPTVEEDLARGRAMRRRRRRRQVGSGLATIAALAAAALAMPISPLSVTDGGLGDVASSSDDPSGTIDLGQHPMNPALWDAVRDAFPDGVAEYSVLGSDTEPGLHIDLDPTMGNEREFIQVSVAAYHADLDAARPCSEPDEMVSLPYDVDDCEEGEDATGRWRIAAGLRDGGQLTVLEGGSASVLIRWDPGPAENSLVSAADLDAIAEAVWEVASGYSADELTAGVDMVAVRDMWPQVEAELEASLGLGELTRDGDVDVDVDEEWRTGSIGARYTTAEGTQFDLYIWQKARLHDGFCIAGTCNPLPFYFSTPPSQSDNALTGGINVTSIGNRGGLVLATSSTDPDVIDTEETTGTSASARATSQLLEMIPWLGENRFPYAD